MADELDKAAEKKAKGKTTMTVARGFTLTLVHGQTVHYKAGIHKNVPAEHAEHWYTKAHLASEDDAETKGE